MAADRLQPTPDAAAVTGGAQQSEVPWVAEAAAAQRDGPPAGSQGSQHPATEPQHQDQHASALQHQDQHASALQLEDEDQRASAPQPRPHLQFGTVPVEALLEEGRPLKKPAAQTAISKLNPGAKEFCPGGPTRPYGRRGSTPAGDESAPFPAIHADDPLAQFTQHDGLSEAQLQAL